jgi:hypothetical protein
MLGEISSEFANSLMLREADRMNVLRLCHPSNS